MAKTTGPYEVYTEVETPNGTVGVPAGCKLRINDDGTATVLYPGYEKGYLQHWPKYQLIEYARQLGAEFRADWGHSQIIAAIEAVAEGRTYPMSTKKQRETISKAKKDANAKKKTAEDAVLEEIAELEQLEG